MALNQKTAYVAGDLYLGTRDPNGNPVNLQNVGLTDEMKISFKEDVKTLKDAYGRLVNTVRLIPEGTVSIDTRDLNLDAVTRALFGKKQHVQAATGVTVTVTGGVAAGQTIPLGHLNVSNIVVTGASAGQYSVKAANGSLTFNTALTGDITITFDHGTYDAIGLLQNSAIDYWLYFEGYNLGNGEPVNLALYRVRFGAAKDFSLIGTDFTKLPLDGDLLVDVNKPMDAQFGQYGYYQQLA